LYYFVTRQFPYDPLIISNNGHQFHESIRSLTINDLEEFSVSDELKDLIVKILTIDDGNQI